MLSRLISLLRRIPAVKWAFTRLRSSPQAGSVDIAPSTAISAATVDVVEAASAPVAESDAVPLHDAAPLHDDVDLAVAAPVAENDTVVCAVAESPSSDICANDASASESPTEAEAVSAVPAVEEVSASSPDLGQEPVATADVVIITDTSAEIPATVEAVVAEVLPLSSTEAETALVDVPDAITAHDPSLIVSETVDPAIDEILAIVVDADSVVAAETPSAEPPVAVTNIEPAPTPVSPAPEIRSVRKVRARPAEPTDRAALIRQRWAETGSRMWNPRLHGAGDATLNIQGSVGLLPPAPGETMPRYDKLEFKMLGGQIVCEGVIVETPVHANQRSFTRLAEPAKPDRVREPVRERQAALA